MACMHSTSSAVGRMLSAVIQFISSWWTLCHCCRHACSHRFCRQVIQFISSWWTLCHCCRRACSHRFCRQHMLYFACYDWMNWTRFHVTANYFTTFCTSESCRVIRWGSRWRILQASGQLIALCCTFLSFLNLVRLCLICLTVQCLALDHLINSIDSNAPVFWSHF
jgi:hypothetical protein